MVMNRIRIISWFVLILMIGSCEPEEECVGCNLNPKISIEFEPEFSLEITDSLFSGVKTEIAELVDSLTAELTTEQIAVFEEELISLRSDSISLSDAYTLLRSGKVQIHEILAPGSIGLEQFADSLISEFALPVNMQSDTSTFYISYYEFIDTLQLVYERNVFQNLDGVRMKITDIGVNEEVSTFDSLRVRCGNSTCSNDQTTVYIYY